MRRRLASCWWTLCDTMSFYAVRKGRKPGVYQTWKQCQEQVVKFTGAKFRKFPTEAEAWDFVYEGITGTENGFHNPSVSPLQEQASHVTETSVKFKMDALFSTATLFQQQLGSLNTLMDKLSSEINDLQTEVDRSAGTHSPLRHQQAHSTCVYKTHGVKRSFSAGCGSDNLGPQPPKMGTIKSEDSPVDYWTGKRFNEEDGVKVYTDGACGANGQNGARAGLGVFWGRNDSRNLSERLSGRPTNNRAEIHAARRAVEQAKAYGIKNLILYTDSQFLINSITTWITGWKQNEWMKTTGEPVINKEDFLQLDQVIQDMNIKWVHVRGHQGIPGNEQADKLAVQGTKKPLPGK